MSTDAENVGLTAVEQFRSARLQAKIEQVKAALNGKSADLLSYEDVREKVRAKETNLRELREIPLDAIVGSVGRYKDFTRRFFPLLEEDEHRWARVHDLTNSMEGLPPIEVYRLGDVFFVRDGNHRVSVARDLGATYIEAYVTKVETPVPLSPDIQPDDLILKERYARFLEHTGLDKAFPDLDLSMSAAGNYRVLERQIAVHQHWVKEQKGEDLTFPETAKRWFRYVYMPVIQIIRERGMMRDFPNRTETDLYVWIDKHRHDLADRLGWSVDAEQAIVDLSHQQTTNPVQAIQQFGLKMRYAITPAALESGPPTGEWRELWHSTHREDRLFTHILVAIDGREPGWKALQLALATAQREQGRIFGLHVLDNPENDQHEFVEQVKAEFERRCQVEGIAGELTITKGQPSAVINYRARWADLVVVSLSYPPGPKPVDRLSSQFAQLLRNCPTPVLAVPRIAAGLDRLLLAYDGSARADEALFVARYMVEQWAADLTVISVNDKKGGGKKSIAKARDYLAEHEVEATFLIDKGRPSKIILKTARDISCDLIIMGGYGSSPLSEIVVGSVVDEVLRTRNLPILVCR